MISQPKVKSKPSRAEYFRNYRKRAKTSLKGGGRGKNTRRRFKFKLWPLTALIIGINTAYLIYTSTKILPGSFNENLIVSLLTEVLLIALVVFQPSNFLEKSARAVLLFGFSIYAIAPYLSEPFKKLESLNQKQSYISERIESLRLEVAQKSKLYEELVARSRITAAERVEKELQHSQNLLRNTVLEVATNAESTAQQSKTPPLVVALQRLLFVLMNMLLSHRLAGEIHSRKTNLRDLKSMRPRLRLVPSTS